MKRLLAIIVATIVLTTAGTAYAGDAWPWVVGGLAGVALLGTIANSHDSQTVQHVYYTPATYTPTYYANASYTTHAPKYHRYYRRSRAQHSPYRNCCERHQRRYYTRNYTPWYRY